MKTTLKTTIALLVILTYLFIANIPTCKASFKKNQPQVGVKTTGPSVIGEVTSKGIVSSSMPINVTGSSFEAEASLEANDLEDALKRIVGIVPRFNVGAIGISLIETGAIESRASNARGLDSIRVTALSTAQNVNILNGLITATKIVAGSVAESAGETVANVAEGTTIEDLVIAGQRIDFPSVPNTVIPLNNVRLDVLGVGTLKINGKVTLNCQKLTLHGPTSSQLEVTPIVVDAQIDVKGLLSVQSVKASVCVSGPAATTSIDLQ